MVKPAISRLLLSISINRSRGWLRFPKKYFSHSFHHCVYCQRFLLLVEHRTLELFSACGCLREEAGCHPRCCSVFDGVGARGGKKRQDGKCYGPHPLQGSQRAGVRTVQFPPQSNRLDCIQIPTIGASLFMFFVVLPKKLFQSSADLVLRIRVGLYRVFIFIIKSFS